MNEEELLKVLNKEKSYKEEDLLLFIYDLRKEIKQLQQENQSLKEDIKNLVRIISKNCDELEGTEEEFESLYRWENE